MTSANARMVCWLYGESEVVAHLPAGCVAGINGARVRYLVCHTIEQKPARQADDKPTSQRESALEPPSPNIRPACAYSMCIAGRHTTITAVPPDSLAARVVLGETPHMERRMSCHMPPCRTISDSPRSPVAYSLPLDGSEPPSSLAGIYRAGLKREKLPLNLAQHAHDSDSRYTVIVILQRDQAAQHAEAHTTSRSRNRTAPKIPYANKSSTMVAWNWGGSPAPLAATCRFSLEHIVSTYP